MLTCATASGQRARSTQEAVLRPGEQISFSFGENWLRYVRSLGADRYEAAKRSLCELLGLESLAGKSFLDAGCGSGVFSLAAVQLQALRVVSIDADPSSVEACRQVKRSCEVPHWEIAEGSVLDEGFLLALGTFDVVYAWGVLHHTGAMWEAMDNVALAVKPGGLLALAIYNRTRTSPLWVQYKRLYNRSGRLVKAMLVWAILMPRVLVRLARLKHPLKGPRGMSVYHDAVDWAGGLPYECASFEEVADYMRRKGFSLKKGRRTRASGCNEFLLERPVGQASSNSPRVG